MPTPHKWRTPVFAPWLPSNTAPVIRDLIVRASLDIGITEMPPGSNRSGIIDEYNIRAGGKVGDYWCATAMGAWWQDVGLLAPKGYGSCDAWVAFAKETGRWIPVGSTPPVGSAVLYGKPGVPPDAQHIGLLIRWAPLPITIEGNTTIEGSAFGASRNGVAVSVKELTKTDPILGYCAPLPIANLR